MLFVYFLVFNFFLTKTNPVPFCWRVFTKNRKWNYFQKKFKNRKYTKRTRFWWVVCTPLRPPLNLHEIFNLFWFYFLLSKSIFESCRSGNWTSERFEIRMDYILADRLLTRIASCLFCIFEKATEKLNIA